MHRKLLGSLNRVLSCLGSQEPEGGVVLGLHPLRLDSVLDLSIFNMLVICMYVEM